MRTNGLTLAAVALAAAGLVTGGARLAASAQTGVDSKQGTATAPPAIGVVPKKPTAPDGTEAKKPDTAQQQKLRAELDALVKQRADLDRHIAEIRGKLGETGRAHQRIELRTGDGPPQVFEFDGDGNGALPPEARKQLEQARKQLHDALGNMKFDDMPQMFDFQFDAGPNGQGMPDMKAFQERMKKWQQRFQDRMQRRFNGDAAPQQDGTDKNTKPDKLAPKPPKTVDV